MNKTGMLLKPNSAGAIRAHAVDQDTLDRMLEAGEIEIRRGTPTTYRMRASFSPVATKEEDENPDFATQYDTKVMTARRAPARR